MTIALNGLQVYISETTSVVALASNADANSNSFAGKHQTILICPTYITKRLRMHINTHTKPLCY